MKVIKNILYCTLLLLLYSCNDDDATAINDKEFVRFGLLLDTDGEILSFPKTATNIAEVNQYTHKSIGTIKIPVVLTAGLKDTPTDIFYEVTTEGNFTGFRISPTEKITIGAGKLTDTIRISFDSKWSDSNVNKIKLKIIRTSDEEVGIGWPNSQRKMDELTVTLGDLTGIDFFFTKSLYQITGIVNEEILIPVRFSQPVTNNMVGTSDLIEAEFIRVSFLDGDSERYNYSIEMLPFTDGATEVIYKFKVLQSVAGASSIKLSLNRNLTNFFALGGIKVATILKSSNPPRSVDVARNWYNVSEPLYRTFGKSWYADPVTGNCRWSTFNCFTKPVVVATGSPFNNGLGYHKYQIAFISNNPPIGTNPFDFRRYYNNSEVSSPGYNIDSALEFFPENGNSTTNGTVRLVPQIITLKRSSNDATIEIPISGQGTYYFNAADNRWEMYLEVHCDETLINGNNDVIRKMYIYSNNNNSANPPDLTTACSSRVNL